MLCPSCKKHETSIVSDKYDKKTNTVKRKRYCVCGHLFATYEKFEKLRKKRKARPDTIWKNIRFIWYARLRLGAAYTALSKALCEIFDLPPSVLDDKNYTYEKERKKTILDCFNEKGKSYFIIQTVKTKKNRKKIYKVTIDGKKQTIRNVTKNLDYWQHRWYLFGAPGIFDFPKPFEFKYNEKFEKFRDKRIDEADKADEAGNGDDESEVEFEFKIINEYLTNKGYKYSDHDDSLDKNIVRKETDEFYKSVCTYITDEKYNQEFFIKNDPPNSDLWESELWWEIYKIIR